MGSKQLIRQDAYRSAIRCNGQDLQRWRWAVLAHQRRVIQVLWTSLHPDCGQPDHCTGRALPENLKNRSNEPYWMRHALVSPGRNMNANYSRYASDCSDEEWAFIEPFMSERLSNGKPRTTNLREVWNAIQFHCADHRGTTILKKRLREAQLLTFCRAFALPCRYEGLRHCALPGARIDEAGPRGTIDCTSDCQAV